MIGWILFGAFLALVLAMAALVHTGMQLFRQRGHHRGYRFPRPGDPPWKRTLLLLWIGILQPSPHEVMSDAFAEGWRKGSEAQGDNR